MDQARVDRQSRSGIRDAGDLALEVEQVRSRYNTVRLHALLGYVTPDDEHTGRGEGLRQAGSRYLSVVSC